MNRKANKAQTNSQIGKELLVEFVNANAEKIKCLAWFQAMSEAEKRSLVEELMADK